LSFFVSKNTEVQGNLLAKL